MNEWRKRYCIVTNKGIYTFKTGPHVAYRVVDATEALMFDRVTSIKSADNLLYSFCITRNDTTQFFFKCSNDGELQRWLGCLGKLYLLSTVPRDDEADSGNYLEELPPAPEVAPSSQ